MRSPSTAARHRTGAHRWAGPTPVETEMAALVGRIQCGLIGSRRLAVAVADDATFGVLVAVAVRAFGTTAVVAVVDHADGAGAAAAWDLAGAAGIDLLDPAAHGPLASADLTRLGIDTLAHPDLAAPPRLAREGGHRVLYPLRDAGVTRAQVDALAAALGVAPRARTDARDA